MTNASNNLWSTLPLHLRHSTFNTLLSHYSFPFVPQFLSFPFLNPVSSRSRPLFSPRKFSICLNMDASRATSSLRTPDGIDTASEEAYHSKLLQDFTEISTVEKAWTFGSSGKGSQAMFSVGQPNLLANVKRKYMLSSFISKESSESVTFQWSPFPIEMNGVSTFLPSPSGSKLLIIWNPENNSPTRFEIWSSSHVESEFQIPSSIHGSVYVDGWSNVECCFWGSILQRLNPTVLPQKFEGISWNSDETLIAYIAEEPVPPKPTFNSFGYVKRDHNEKDPHSWKGQGEFEEEWGECYAGKRQPALFVINVISGEVNAVQGIGKSLSVGQVVWAPSSDGDHPYLVFIGWPSDGRKLGIKYCYNRPCALYAVKAPVSKSDGGDSRNIAAEGNAMVSLTQGISSAIFPRFSPDGKFLIFVSARSAVDSGAHWATNSLHRIEWSFDGKPCSSVEIIDVVPVVMCPEDDCFPGLYCSKILSNPWLSDGTTMVLSSVWGSTEAILTVNVLSGVVTRISPNNSAFSWDLLALDVDNIIAVSSSPVDIPQLKYGFLNASNGAMWNWLNVAGPISRASVKVQSFLSSRQFDILKIPVKGSSENLTPGSRNPYEAIFVSSKSKNNIIDPLIVVIHGGPHSVSTSSFSKSLAFLTSLGYSLLIVNYRGSLGFGEEALQSLPGKVGSQDVNDVLGAIDHVLVKGLADPSKVAVVGGSHGGFLTTHLIGQAPDRFAAAAARNPVCNIGLMVGTSDIPDWCYVEAFGTEGKSFFTEVPSAEHYSLFFSKSPIAHVSKVKTPTLFLLGAKDLRVPVSNGMQYARVLKGKGGEVKIIVFPEDIHGIEKPQSDFESCLNIGVWFNKYCK